MNLDEYYQKIRIQIALEINEAVETGKLPLPSAENIFAEIVMNHLDDADFVKDSQVCTYEAKIKNKEIKLSGYSINDDKDELDLFISLFKDVEEVKEIDNSSIITLSNSCLNFIAESARGELHKIIERSADAYNLVQTIYENWNDLDRIRIFVITNCKASSKHYRAKEIKGKSISVEVMDIQRLFSQTISGRPRDEISIDFSKAIGMNLPCVSVRDAIADYDFALAAFSGQLLQDLYQRFGSRLLEANVRSYLDVGNKVNRGIIKTLKDEPEHFMAFNNGLVMIADEAGFAVDSDGDVRISFLKGMQIVNGGQTTASIYFGKRKSPSIDLASVSVPIKIIIPRANDELKRERLITDISLYANSQTAVKFSDLSSNKSFHIQFEQLANNTNCPDGISRWFYERASGSYNVLLAREGNTAARMKRIREAIPPKRKIKKEELAKFIQAWRQLPHIVSLGSQKNLKSFIEEIDQNIGMIPDPLTVLWYKEAIAKSIIYKEASSAVDRHKFPQGKANVTAYLISVISYYYHDLIKFDRIWQKQTISEPFKQLISDWAIIVFETLRDKSSGKQIPEFAKRPECWEIIKQAKFPKSSQKIPEIDDNYMS